MSEAQNFAVLFSGGGKPVSNNSRYYNSIKSNYDALIGRGLKPENITLAFASGVDVDTKLSRDFDTKLQLEHLFEGINPTSDKITNKQWNSLYEEYGVSAAATQTLLREFVEAALLEINLSTMHTMSAKVDQRDMDFIGNLEIELEKVNNSLSENDASLMIKFSVKTDANDNTKNIVNLDFIRKSDFSFVENGTKIIPGTKSALDNAIKLGDNSLTKKITDNDSLFVWTFDHGGYGVGDVDSNNGNLAYPSNEGINKANLTAFASEGESVDIEAVEFKEIFKDVTLNSNVSTFAFAQCFSGGLLQAMLDDPELAQSSNWFGMAAANQYEVSYGSFFADAVAKGLKAGVNSGGKLFDSILETDYQSLAPQGYSPNEYPKKYWDALMQGKHIALEHPWFSPLESFDNPIFVDNSLSDGRDMQGVEILDLESLSDSLFTFSYSLVASEDQSLNLFDELKSQFGDLSDAIFYGYSQSAIGTIDYEENADSLIYTPLADTYGQDSFILRFYDGIFSFDFKIDIDVESVNDAPIAVDDFFQISSGERDVLIDVDDAPGFLDDTDVDGDKLSIASYSAPANGTIEKVGDFLFEYQPNAGFVGSDSFLYVLSDGEAFDVAEVLIDVVDSTF